MQALAQGCHSLFLFHSTLTTGLGGEPYGYTHFTDRSLGCGSFPPPSSYP